MAGRKKINNTIAKFVVPGKPVGYTTTNRGGGKSKSILMFWEYCKYVRMYANRAGIKTPLESSYEDPISIRVVSYFSNKVHADTGNIEKGIKDALFYGAKKPGDKYTGGSYSPPKYDKENPRAVVYITKRK